MECKKVHLHIFYQIFKYCVSVQFLDIIFTWVFYAMSYFHTNILTPCFDFYDFWVLSTVNNVIKIKWTSSYSNVLNIK